MWARSPRYSLRTLPDMGIFWVVGGGAEAGELGGDGGQGPVGVQAARIGHDPQAGRADRLVLRPDLGDFVPERIPVGGYPGHGDETGLMPGTSPASWAPPAWSSSRVSSEACAGPGRPGS